MITNDLISNINRGRITTSRIAAKRRQKRGQIDASPVCVKKGVHDLFDLFKAYNVPQEIKVPRYLVWVIAKLTHAWNI